jgi:outer membrane protein assembly factor BamB
MVALGAMAAPTNTERTTETVLARPADLPDRLYNFETYMTGTDDVTVVMTEGPSPERPAIWQAYDAKGQVLWTRAHTCPDFDAHTEPFVVDDSIVCKSRRSILAVDLVSGDERWRFTDSRNLYITAGAQGVVATSINNEEVAVLDAKNGSVLQRFNVGGAVLEAVAATPKGPLALLVQDPPGKVEETIVLPGEAGEEPLRIGLSGLDKERRLVAQPLSRQPLGDGLQPLAPLWTTPFEGYSYAVFPSGGAVVGEPSEGMQVGWDLTNGKVLWSRPLPEDEVSAFGSEGGAFARPARGGKSGFVYGTIDPMTGRTRWERPMADGEVPLAAGQGSNVMGFITKQGLLVADFATGRATRRLTVPKERELTSMRATPSFTMWVTKRDWERWFHVAPVAP